LHRLEEASERKGFPLERKLKGGLVNNSWGGGGKKEKLEEIQGKKMLAIRNSRRERKKEGQPRRSQERVAKTPGKGVRASDGETTEEVYKGEGNLTKGGGEKKKKKKKGGGQVRFGHQDRGKKTDSPSLARPFTGIDLEKGQNKRIPSLRKKKKEKSGDEALKKTDSAVATHSWG